MDQPSVPPERTFAPRLLLAALAALVVLVPIVVALVLTSGPSTSPAAAKHGRLFTPVAGTHPARRDLPPGRGAVVALVRRPTAMRATPGGHIYAKVQRRTPFGSPQAMWVVRRSGSWLGVISPLAGNGRVGWIPVRAASLSRVDWELEVSLATRRLTVLRSGRVQQKFRVAIGMPSAPTPTGRFAVTDRLLTGDPSGPYGCCILALSAEAPHAIQGWTGGSRIAIHSTPETSSIGQAASHGCLRLTLAEGRWLIHHVPLGTPALISSA
jgi:hypothetical protein